MLHFDKFPKPANMCVLPSSGDLIVRVIFPCLSFGSKATHRYCYFSRKDKNKQADTTKKTLCSLPLTQVFVCGDVRFVIFGFGSDQVVCFCLLTMELPIKVYNNVI